MAEPSPPPDPSGMEASGGVSSRAGAEVVQSPSQPAMGTSPERAGEEARGSAGGMDSSSEPPSLRVASTSDGTRRARRIPRSSSKQRIILGPGNPLLTSPTTCGLASVVIRSIDSHVESWRAGATQRSVDQWRTGAQISRRCPFRSGRRLPSPVDVSSRGVVGIDGSARAPTDDLARRPDPEALPPFPWR